MRNAITVHNNRMPLVEFQGQRVVTFAMVDKAHQRPDGTAAATFRRHRHRFTEKRHFFELTGDVLHRQTLAGLFPAHMPMNNFSNGQSLASPMLAGFALAENLSKLDMRRRSAGGPLITFDNVLAAFIDADRYWRSTLSQQNNSLKNEIGLAGVKTENSATDKTAGFRGCLLVEIDAGTEQAKKKGEDFVPALWCCVVSPFGRYLHAERNLSSFSLPHRLGEVEQDFVKIKNSADSTINKTANAVFIAHPFGSIPCRFNSCLASFFNQLAKLTPDLADTSSNCSLNSGVKRMLKMGDLPAPLGLLSRFTIDMYGPVIIISIVLGPYIIMCIPKVATPRSGGTLPRRLTTNDRFCIEVAMKNHTTAPQRFTFLFLAVVRANPQAHPHRERVTAVSEREARSLLAGRYVLVFAGRLPALEVTHG